MIILGIETSCDETGVAVYNSNTGFFIDKIYSQINISKKYGGTVPELSSRDHTKKLLSLILLTLKESNIKLKDITGIAYTKGPGLTGSLFTGTSLAKSLALSLNIPAIGINHLEAHILINMLYNKSLDFPFIALLISGAHTAFIKVNSFDDYILMGETIDDGIGETFDKISRLLKLKHIGGKYIENISNSNKKFYNYNFPKALMNKNCFDFSFSGLKTSVSNKIYNENLNFKDIPNFAYNFQNTLIKIVSKKCINILIKTKITSLVIAGGVSANKQLRKELIIITDSLGVKFYLSPIKFCTDNGVMIAFCGYIKFKMKKMDKELCIDVFHKSN